MMRTVFSLTVFFPLVTEGLLLNATVTEHGNTPLDPVVEAADTRWLLPGRVAGPFSNKYVGLPENRNKNIFEEHRQYRQTAMTMGSTQEIEGDSLEVFRDTLVKEKLIEVDSNPSKYPYVSVEYMKTNPDESATIWYNVYIGDQVQETATSIKKGAVAKVAGAAGLKFEASKICEFFMKGKVEGESKFSLAWKPDSAMMALSLMISADVEAKFPNIDGLGAAVHAEAGASADMAINIDFNKMAVSMKAGTFAGVQFSGKLKLRWLNLKAKAKLGVGGECTVGVQNGVAGFEFGAALGPGAGVGLDICYGQIQADIGQAWKFLSEKVLSGPSVYVSTFGDLCGKMIMPTEVLSALSKLGKEAAAWWR